MKHRRYSGVVAGALLFNSPPVFSQEVICCGLLWTVPGADWVGASRDCAGTMATITKQQKNKVCEAMAAFPGACKTPIAASVIRQAMAASPGTCICADADCGVRDEDRCKKTKVPGSTYVSSRSGPAGKIHRQPGSDSPVLSSPPNGTRVVYRDVRRSGGQTWYYVTIPGREAGWISGGETACVRPEAPVPPRMIRPIDPGLTKERPTAAQTASARG